MLLSFIFFLLKIAFYTLLIDFTYANAIISKLDSVKKDFSGFVGDTTSCAYDDYDNKLYFENHTVDLEKNMYGKYCGGVSLHKDKLYTCVNCKNVNNGNNYFRIIESDVYYTNQNIIFEQEFDYKLDAECYNNIIYFGWKNSSYKSKIDIMGYNIESKEYIGIVSSGKKKRVSDYVYSIKERSPYSIVVDPDWEPFRFQIDLDWLGIKDAKKVEIKKADVKEPKYITKFKLNNNEVGNVVCKQNNWYWSTNYECVNDKLFLTCVIEASTSWFNYKYYNIVFEYDFENDSLKYRFRYTSDDTNEGINLLFGYV